MIDAEKREKVIRGLKACGCSAGVLKICEVMECPYRVNHGACVHLLAHDALALLKEQEPRVMTWNEILRASEIESPPVWLEDNDKIHVVPAFVIGSLLTLQNDAITFVLRGKRIGANKSDYGVRWRAWNAKPTPDQRQEVPWE